MRLNNSWNEILNNEFESGYFKPLSEFLRGEYAARIIYPPKNDVFNCFKLTPPENVKAVILGQDPYIGEGQAHGLCFSVKDGVSLPPSLKNIYKELSSDTGFKTTNSGDLTKWASQGVLLLNTCLTVRAGQVFSHHGRGWEIFTDNIISKLNGLDTPIVFMLWGSHARQKKNLLNNPRHLILEAAHPSPLSAVGFFGCKHFSKANDFLAANGIARIDWQIDAAV
jgi:uracil-DNA glycosylase